MICLDSSDVRCNFYLDTANHSNFARNVLSCRTCDIVFALTQAAM